jgi:hypothetical protein
MWRVCAIALSFVSGWRAFYSVSLCKNIADRMHLQGPPEAVVEAFRLLVSTTAPIGLTPSLLKCAAYAQSAATGLAVASDLGIAHRPEGLVAAGTPLGSDGSFRPTLAPGSRLSPAWSLPSPPFPWTSRTSSPFSAPPYRCA